MFCSCEDLIINLHLKSVINYGFEEMSLVFATVSCFKIESVSASGTGQIRLESPRPAMPDAEPILTGMARCPVVVDFVRRE